MTTTVEEELDAHQATVEAPVGFTPGPWKYQEVSDAYTHIVRAGDRFLCQLAQDTSGEAEANARLMASAPDLLSEVRRLKEALERVLALAHWTGNGEANYSRIEDIARSALSSSPAEKEKT